MRPPKEIIQSILLETKERNYSLAVAKRFLKLKFKGNIHPSVLESRYKNMMQQHKTKKIEERIY